MFDVYSTIYPYSLFASTSVQYRDYGEYDVRPFHVGFLCSPIDELRCRWSQFSLFVSPQWSQTSSNQWIRGSLRCDQMKIISHLIHFIICAHGADPFRPIFLWQFSPSHVMYPLHFSLHLSSSFICFFPGLKVLLKHICYLIPMALVTPTSLTPLSASLIHTGPIYLPCFWSVPSITPVSLPSYNQFTRLDFQIVAFCKHCNSMWDFAVKLHLSHSLYSLTPLSTSSQRQIPTGWNLTLAGCTTTASSTLSNSLRGRSQSSTWLNQSETDNEVRHCQCHARRNFEFCILAMEILWFFTIQRSHWSSNILFKGAVSAHEGSCTASATATPRSGWSTICTFQTWDHASWQCAAMSSESFKLAPVTLILYHAWSAVLRDNILQFSNPLCTYTEV